MVCGYGEVCGGVLGAHGLVDPAAREIEEVAGFQSDLPNPTQPSPAQQPNTHTHTHIHRLGVN